MAKGRKKLCKYCNSDISWETKICPNCKKKQGHTNILQGGEYIMKHIKLTTLTVAALLTFSATITPAHAAWQQTDNKWCYSNSTLDEYSTGWDYIDGKWYLFDENGWMLTGWQEVGDKWFYMNLSGEMVTGWLLDAGNWYYMDSSGAMLTDTITPDGYWVGSDGVMIQNLPEETISEGSTVREDSPISDVPYNGYTIVVNTNTQKYHKPTCRHVETIKLYHTGYCSDESYLKSHGYSACKTCH